MEFLYCYLVLTGLCLFFWAVFSVSIALSDPEDWEIRGIRKWFLISIGWPLAGLYALYLVGRILILGRK
jgi:hypothetical protein